MNCIPTELIRPYILLCLRVKDFLCLRLVSRDIFNAVTKASIPRLTEKEHLYPRATLICSSECMVCGRRGRMEQKSVPYDDFPRRLFLYCRRVDCLTRTLASMINLATEERRTLLYDCSHTKHHFDCPRSSGGTTPATCDKTWKHIDGKVRAEWCHFYEDNAGACYYCKDVELPDGVNFIKKQLSFY